MLHDSARHIDKHDLKFATIMNIEAQSVSYEEIVPDSYLKINNANSQHELNTYSEPGPVMCTLGNTHDCCLNCTDGGTKEYTEQQSLAHSSSWKNQVFFYLDLGTSCSTSISIDHSEPGACPWLVF